MITVKLKASNGNYLCTREPSSSNCWGNKNEALVLTLSQARELVNTVPFCHDLDIVISSSWHPLDDFQFNREKFCMLGGMWHNYTEGAVNE